jgi:ADP-dependent NAD(P)H-hydrate dehydratase / NAD(P)H-hydrate epimerase
MQGTASRLTTTRRLARVPGCPNATDPSDRPAPARPVHGTLWDVPTGTIPLPADDPELATLSLDELELRWAEAAARTPISAASMTGADRKAQALGIAGETLMEHAGTAVAAGARALAERNGREGRPVLVLAGPGNNGGDGFVAARRLAEWGVPVIAVLVATEERPGTPDAARNWKRLDGLAGVTKVHAPVARDVAILGQGIDKAGVVVDALLGTGVQGRLREPIRSAVEMIGRAREAGVPVLAVDTPTAVDLTSGDPSDPVVRADMTVTFHRPKTGLRSRIGRALAGRVLVAPIGIPSEADRG